MVCLIDTNVYLMNAYTYNIFLLYIYDNPTTFLELKR